MSVIPFPVRPQAPPTGASLLMKVVVALAHLGEPATTSELRRALVDAGFLEPTQPCSALDVVLHALMEGESGAAPPVFRQVDLRGRPAWAFTPGFRSWLSQQGVRSALRPLEGGSPTPGGS